MKAFFGPPVAAPAPGGTQLSVYLVPVFQGRLVVFDVEAPEARGRWLPWDVLAVQENPYEAASELADIWCGVPLSSLTLADVMSLTPPGGAWELAVVFRAELSAPPRGDAARRPAIFESGQYDAVGSFDPVDLERWVTRTGDGSPGAAPKPEEPIAPRPSLLF